MERVNSILTNYKFIRYLSRTAQLEEIRVFCKHDMSHLIDVARISYIICLENNTSISKELLYATALLHDIGRWKEYEEGMDHALASKALALEILQECEFKQEEIELICDAIGHHRTKENHASDLSKFLYQADKLSRPCISCKAIKQCKRYANGEVATLKY